MDTEDENLPKPTERNAKRRSPQITFGEDGCAQGWAYLVPRAFRPALDIVFSERVKTVTSADGEKVKRRHQEWTEGDPPAFAFRETDSLGSSEMVSGTTTRNRFLAQITQAAPDKVEQKRIHPGSVGFRLFECQAGEPDSYVEKGFYICTQAAFVEFLRSGVVPADAKQ
jgi:hypothetical protein